MVRRLVGVSAALTCSKRNVSLVNTKLPAAARQHSSPAPSGVPLRSAHTAVLFELHSGVLLKLVDITSLRGSLAFRCKNDEGEGARLASFSLSSARQFAIKKIYSKQLSRPVSAPSVSLFLLRWTAKSLNSMAATRI